MPRFLWIGWICGSEQERNCSEDINKQHEVLMSHGDYIYYPYCGEKLESESE